MNKAIPIYISVIANFSEIKGIPITIGNNANPKILLWVKILWLYSKPDFLANVTKPINLTTPDLNIYTNIKQILNNKNVAKLFMLKKLILKWLQNR